MENYKLYLYKPNATVDDFLGELLVDNLQVNIKLHEMSSISFTMPEVVNGVANVRLDEVLDGYVVELWYGRVTGVADTDYYKMRFILHTTPLDYNDFKRTYSYEGFSFESILEFKQINNWEGVEIKDFYREPKYNNSTTGQYTEVAASGQTIPNHPYVVTAKTVGTGNYIRIAPTTATATPLDIYVYEVRENTSTDVYNEIAYIRYTGTTYNEVGFKQGYYFLDMDANDEYVEYIYIYVPDNYEDFDGEPSNKKLSFKVYDNPISRHYAVGVNRNDENPYTNMYIDLAQDAEDGDAAEYGNYSFVTQPTYSKNGLKLEHVLLGNIESRTGGSINNNALTSDGLLYNTDFTIGTIHADIAAKYRSNLEYNNITVYQAIRDLAESFDAIAVFDTILKTVSFYPENADTWPNKGLILKYGTYLKNIKKDIDASKIVTAARGIGKDNLNTIALITPDGSDSWQDFSYYLDEFYIDPEISLSDLNAAGFTFTLENPSGDIYYLGISYPNADDTSSYQSRWMDASEAKKVAKWQFNRDFMHKVLLGEIKPSEVDYSGLDLSYLDRYYDLYNIRSEAINDYVQSDTTLSKRKAESYRYKYLYDFYDKKVKTQNPFDENNPDSIRFLDYKQLWEDTQAAVAAQEVIVENKRLEIFESTVADSIGDKLSEVRTSLNKVTTFLIDIDKLDPFIKEFIVNDSKLDNDLDLLDAVVTHVNENKIPRITIDVGIVDILAAQEAYEDWNKLKVGDLVSIYYPEFNIDQEVQIRELSIDFEAHTASLVISSVRNYNKGYGNYISKVIKRLTITERNVVNNLQDSNRITNKESNETYQTLNGGTIPTSEANIIFGSQNNTGTSSTSFSGIGFESLTVEDVDPLFETVNFGVDKSVVIKDGVILASNRDDTDTFTSEVEISADKGIEIRKITGSVENEDLNVLRQVYIDTNGNAVFSGFVSVNQETVGYDQQGVFIGEDGEVSKFSLVSGNTSMIFDPAATDYKLKINGEAKIGPLTLGAIGSTFVTGISGTTYPKIIIGQVDILQSDFTFTDTDITNVGVTHFIYQQGGTITSRTMKIELYKNSSKVYDSAVVSIPDIFGYNIETTYFDFPLINADAVRVIITGTKSVSSGAGWQVTQQPIISTPSANIKMGNFSVDSQGLLSTTNGIFTNQATFGNVSSIKIQGGTSGDFTSTFRPSTNFTAHHNIWVPNQEGTILLNTTNPGPALNIYSTDDITISNEGYANKDINIIADDNLVLESATNDVELNAADHIDLVATNGTYVYGDLTVNNNLIVKGATITVDSTTLTVNDKNIEIGSVDNSARPFTVISGSNQITGGSTLGIFEGQTITGSGIPAGTTVDSVVNSSTIRMSANATSTGTPATLTFGRKFNTTNSSTSINTGNTRGLIVGQSITGTGIPANTRISSITNETTLVMTNAATATNTQTSLVFGSATDFTADGGGITLKGTSDKTIIWYDDNNAWEFNQGIEVVGNVISLDAGQSLKLSGISDPTHRLFHDASTDYDVVEYSTGFQLRHYQTGNQLTLTGSNGRVGIGTATPAELLDVNGNITHQGLVMTTGTNVDQTKQTTFTSALTTAWTDVTGVSGTYLTTGSYIVQIESNGEYYTGQMSWFSGSTTSAIADEIQLHRAGPTASAARIYARVIRVSAGTLKLQVAASTSVGSHTMTFKFRRTI